jgi:hypothetical protein
MGDLSIPKHHVAMRYAVKAIPADLVPPGQIERQWIKGGVVGNRTVKDGIKDGELRHA